MSKKKEGKIKSKFLLKLLNFGLSKERDFFIDNLSILVSSGMPILEAVKAISMEMRSRRMQKIITEVHESIEAGMPFSKAINNTGIFSSHAISLMTIGERSGRFVENLKIVSLEQEKERILKSKLWSAMMYPVFVFGLTVFIGIGIAWFILPKLATVFSQLRLQLPIVTKILINFGIFLGKYGIYAVPLFFVLLFVLFYFLFIFSKTRIIGQYILFSFPIVKDLIKEVEISRFGYLLGTLLSARIPIVDTFDSLVQSTSWSRYKILYTHLKDKISEGNSFKKSFKLFPKIDKLLPITVQQFIIAGEKSGTIPETLIRIGENYENKIETTTKNLTTIFEPVLLVIVWVGVIVVALAIILPIYNMIGGLNQGINTVPAPIIQEAQTPLVSEIATTTEMVEESGVATTTELEIIMPEVATTSGEIATSTPILMLEIIPTGIGYLNVRIEPSSQGRIVGRVKPGEKYEYIDEQQGWYKIVLSATSTGWVSGKYIKK